MGFEQVVIDLKVSECYQFPSVEQHLTRMSCNISTHYTVLGSVTLTENPVPLNTVLLVFFVKKCWHGFNFTKKGGWSEVLLGVSAQVRSVSAC